MLWINTFSNMAEEDSMQLLVGFQWAAPQNPSREAGGDVLTPEAELSTSLDPVDSAVTIGVSNLGDL
jgi:hypothetical protein